MKKKIIASFTLLFALSFFYLGGCKPSEREFNAQGALELIERINAAPSGLQIKVERANIQTDRDPESPEKSPWYFITLANPEVTFDTSILKEMNYRYPEFKFTLKMEKMVLQHGPKDNYLGFGSASGFDFEMDLLKEMEQFKQESNKFRETFSEATIECHLGNLAIEKLNMSPFLEEKISFLELIAKMASLNASLKTNMENFSTEMSFKARNKPLNRIKISAENILTDQETNSDFIKLYFSSPENNKIKITELLKEPRTLFKALFDANKISVSAKENGMEKIKINGERLNLSEYLIPSDENGFYKFGFTAEWHDFEIISPNKILEAAGQIKHAKKQLNFDHLSPALLQAYLKYVKRTQAFKQPLSEETREEMASLGFGIMSEFFQSQPVISFSLSPLEHRFGKIEAEAEFQIKQPGMPPLGKAAATLYNLAEFEERIKEANIIPAEKADKVIDLLKKHFILDESGNGKLIFEIRREAPHLYLNDKPLKIK